MPGEQSQPESVPEENDRQATVAAMVMALCTQGQEED